MELILRAFNLKLKHTFSISRVSYNEQPTLIVELKDGNISGFGEATSNPYYHITIQKMMDDLTKMKTIIENTKNLSPEEFWRKINPYLKQNMFALCALDEAYNDLYARKKGEKLYELWGYTISRNPLSNYTIGIDSVEKMVFKMKELPWPIYKIKLGTKDDIKIVSELRKHTNAIFRIDANCGWTVDETIKNAKSLKNLGVEFLEQPLKADDWDAHKVVFNQSVLPVMADESCQIEADVEKCYNHFHGRSFSLVTPASLPGSRYNA